ncbi:hypothetical protein ACFVUW_06060 [Streptomyces xiamenensis]|uniref:hypothetical protein n=1 Tax=Streptomyces xiamenensis TaxID=408015 RepID=UPI0036E4BA00
MKPLLWCVLLLALTVNLSVNFVVDEGALQIVLSVCSGVVLIGSGVGLWMLRDRGDAQAY